MIWMALALDFSGAGALPEDTLIIGVGRDFLDGPASRTYLHGSTHTWEALTYLDENLNACPWLARSWEIQDQARTWIFHLRENVRFHDNTPLTADLAKQSILRIASSPRYDPSGVFKDLETLEARGELDLVFHLKKPCPVFANRVSYYQSPVLHPRDFEPDGRLKSVTGTGPFYLKQAVPGDRIILEAFEGYWGIKPHFTRVVFRNLADAQTRAMALMAREVDAVADVGAILPQQVETLKHVSGLVLDHVEVATTHYLVINCAKPPFMENSHRQWLASVIDREAIVDALVAGCGRVAKDPFTPLAKEWCFGYLDGSWNPVKMPLPVAVDILLHAATLERWPYLDIAQFIQMQLGRYGFKASIHIREPGAYYKEMKEGRFSLALQPNTLMTGEPDFFYAYYLASDGPRSYGCGCARTDELIARGRHSSTRAEQKPVYRQLSRQFSRDLPLLPLYHDISFFAYTDRLGFFGMDHNFRPLLVQAKSAGGSRKRAAESNELKSLGQSPDKIKTFRVGFLPDRNPVQ
ncbi:ABC transporter substrate-binding protein [Desulfospira joergensenii]|uniref:ABC transporter substrate-binding protein n=1 Tax=Desulfospira joergensenii TaxID=53329 RepID=UPI0003B57D97|nr:ABC transporter substrate-binding protein [Desulfospira joergensenii]